MQPIPPNIRKQLAKDPFMRLCIHTYAEGGCQGRIEWEHAEIYAGRQIQEVWSIVPCCTYHHRGAGLNKKFNQYHALKRAMQLRQFVSLNQKYPRVDWIKKYNQLKKLFKKYDNSYQEA